MKKIFIDGLSQYSQHFAEHGYVHIHKGLTEEFRQLAAKQVEAYLRGPLMERFAIGDKQQVLYEFPDDGSDYLQQLFQGVGRVCGLDPADMTLSERHIKTYDADANPRPLAHKDRYASEISIGFSIDIPQGSTLILYPYDELDINRFDSSTEYRDRLSVEESPESRLATAKRVEIQDGPGDVVMFRGHKIWHMRWNAAGSTLLYLKLNTFNCDPLGEDPRYQDPTSAMV